MLCVCSVVLMAGVFPLRQPMLMAFGASDATYGYANTYFTVYLCGTVFNLLALGLNQFIICQGYARKGMISVMLGGGTEHRAGPGVHLSLLTWGGGWGCRGHGPLSAGQLPLCTAVPLPAKSVPIAITFGGYDGRLMLRILAVGMTPFLIIGVDNIMIISMNAILQSYGGAELGRPSGDLRHHRPELHAGGDHAPGRHFRRHRHHPGVQLRRPAGTGS